MNEEGSAREYVEISGSGSGPSSDVKLETGIYLKGGKTTVSVAKGNSLTIEYVFSSANTMTRYNKKTQQFEKIQQQTGTIGSVRYLLAGIQFDSGNIKQSNYNETDDTKNTYNKFVVPASRFTASTHELKIIASDSAGNSATESFAVGGTGTRADEATYKNRRTLPQTNKDILKYVEDSVAEYEE